MNVCKKGTRIAEATDKYEKGKNGWSEGNGVAVTGTTSQHYNYISD